MQLDLVKVKTYRENLSGSANDTNPSKQMEENAIRIPIVGVMGSGTQSHAERASRLGHWLALEGVHLLTGGGGGVMTAVSQAFYETPERRGLVIAIIPSTEGAVATKAGYPNKWVEIPIFTHLPLIGERGTEPLSRNHINVLSADVIIALPGSVGTRSEVELALAYGRPIVGYLESREEIPGLPQEVPICGRLEDVENFVRTRLSPLHLDLTKK